MKKLLLLDRDGVLNQDRPDYVKSLEEWVPIPHSLETVVQLQKRGFLTALFTNQAGIRKGLYTEETLHVIHAALNQRLQFLGGHALDAIAHCPHHSDYEPCLCRKPQPGLILDIFRRLDINPKVDTVHLVGDATRDLEAGHRAGVTSLFLVQTGRGIEEAARLKANPPIYHYQIASSLRALVNRL